MATFVYAPAIRVRIESQNQGIIDVSGDLVNWTLTRRSNTVSSFNFVLQNAQRKYDGVFRPSDRITVQLKRITWVNVFTGSLNNSPVFSAWPRALPLSASCSLKKLQFWPWDATTTAASNMVQQFFAGNNGTLEGTSAVGDGGLSKLVTEALVQVSGWDRKAIHFGQVPNAWFKWAQKTEQDIDLASSMAAVLGSTAILNGQQIIGSLSLPAGKYAGENLTAEQAANAASIYAFILGDPSFSTTQMQDHAALITIMAAYQESRLRNLNHGDRDSLGMLQQRSAWGTAEERQNLQYEIKVFIHGVAGGPKGLLSFPNWASIDPGQAVQAVQVSATPDAYSKWENFANSVVTTLRALYTNQIKQNANQTTITGGLGDGLPTGRGLAKTTGTNLASVASDLITSRPAGSIRYQEGNDNSPQTTSPTVLDCSSLVEWCYYHATGNLLNHRTAENQYSLCQTYHLIPLELAKSIQGALLFTVSNGDAHHVGISLGNGQHVAAHTDGIPLPEQVNISDIATNGGFNAAGLLPSIDYTKSATTQAAATQLQAILKMPTSVSPSQIGPGTDPSNTTTGAGTNATSIFQQLVTAISNPPVVSGDIFGGAREFIHNTTFLPWIKNMTNASMRAFCSAPNGDFIAWFPDYFNIWGTAAIMNVQPIELQDFTVDWSDQQIVTHEYVIGSIAALLDNTSGGILSSNDASYSGLTQMLTTNGIATMDFPQIFQAIYGKPASQKFVTDYLTRFGARPNLDQMANIQHGRQEFFMALWNFMYYWSAQFSAEVPMTFMPELYPGMILKIPAFDFQAYVTEVEHSGSYGENGGFTTKATIVAPARTSSRDDLFGMLPLGGK